MPVQVVTKRGFEHSLMRDPSVGALLVSGRKAA
jgi:hypothetical protein